MKNKTIKKLLSAVLVAAMAVSMLAGCGNTTAPATETTTSEAAPADDAAATDAAATDAAAPATGEPVTINLMRACYNIAIADADQLQKVEDAINAYIKDKINVQVNITEVNSGEYGDKANLALANNEINLLWTASWWAVIGTNELYAANAAYDITDLLPGSALYESMDAAQWEGSKYNGRNYFVPVYKDNVEGYDLMFRQELVDKFGWDLSTVKSLPDLEPMLADAKADGIKYPFLTQHTGMFYRFYLNDFDFFCGDNTASWIAVDRATDEVVNTIQTPQYKEFCELMAKWGEAGYVSEDEVTKTTTDTTMMSKDWAVSWWTDIPINDEADSRYGQDISVAPLTDRWAHSTSCLGSCYAITANSTPEQAQACVDFLGLLFTDSKLADMYTFGIEGEDFVYTADGFVDLSANGANVTESGDPGSSQKYNHSMWESASATAVTPTVGEPADKGDVYKTFNGGAKASCAAGFRFDKKPVEASFAACQNIFDTYGHPLENGGYAVGDVEATIADYQAALDEAGYQDVLAEMQKQYNDWKATK